MTAMIRTIRDISPADEDTIKKTVVDLKTIMDRQLSNIVSKKSLVLFGPLKIRKTFLEEDSASWKTFERNQLARSSVDTLAVGNDHAERGVVLVQGCSGLIRKDEQQLQFLLQVVEEHRRRYPDALKKALAECQ